MPQDIRLQLKIFNKIYKEMDIVYHNYAKNVGLSDTAFWILYSMAEDNSLFTQRDFCENWSFTPQTVNSALKDLERQNIISLEPVPGNKKNKWIKLTEKGKQLTEQAVIPVIDSECKSFEVLSKTENDLMLSATQKYIDVLKNKINNLLQNFNM